MAEVTCPTCATVIDTTERCPETIGLGRCMEFAGHEGWHWTDFGRPGVTIWTGLYRKKSCAGRMDLTRWCQKEPGHEGHHNDGRGVSFSDPEPMEVPV